MKFSILVVTFLSLITVSAQTNHTIYSDSLQNGWQNWSWATVNLANNSPVHSGSKSISVYATGTWQAAYFHHNAMDSSPFTNLTFWLHGGPSGGQQFQVQGTLNQAPQASVVNLPALAANAWQQFSISLSALGVANRQDFDGFWIQDRAGVTFTNVYIDDIALVGPDVALPPATNALVSISVDTLRNRHAISDLIYGVAFATSNQVNELNTPLNRSGGNAETRYNWQLNANNRAFDWYFQSIPESSTNAGGAADALVAATKGNGAEPMLTIPMIGWVAKLGPNRGKLASYSISKYGPQTGNDWEWYPDAGNGISVTNNTPITWNDPNDANVLTDSTFQQDWVRHLTNTWGMSTNGGVRYYLMDNEPSLWHSTHRDVHPVGATMREVRDKFFEYAEKVKAVDPNALVAAPEEWGWSGYLFSGYDQQWGSKNGWSNLPDRGTNGGWDYLPWFLDQARQRATNTNQRLLDIFTVHFYPQGGEYNPQDEDLSESMQLRRNRSTRALWDTNYVDQTWIADKVQLIPRLRNWVNTWYPGTKIGITEYNWGAEQHINGATTQADILGIFGRENLDLATFWTTPPTASYAYNAIKMYRNYDGSKSTFGQTSVYAGGPDPDLVSTFASVRTNDGALTIMVINKQLTGVQPLALSLTNFQSSGAVEVWQLNTSNIISRMLDIAVTANTISNMVPPQSITLFVVQPSLRPELRLLGRSSGSLQFELRGQPGERYVIQGSTNLSQWSGVLTNTLTATNWNFSLGTSNLLQFYRAARQP